MDSSGDGGHGGRGSPSHSIPQRCGHSSSPPISIEVLSVIVAGVAILVSKMLFEKTANS